MTDLTPAGELREAARLMKERAGAAEKGPWQVLERHGLDYADEGWSQVQVTAGQGDMHTMIAEMYADASYASDVPEENAAHVASWHPLVALAVAEWLEGVAESHHLDRDAGECPNCGSAPCGPHPEIEFCRDCADDWPCAWAGPALKVARAYLGSKESTDGN